MNTNTPIRKTIMLMMIIFSAVLFSFKTTNGKITICHVPPGNPGNCHEITISMNALQAHLNHGDTFYCENQKQYEAVVEFLQANPGSNVTIVKSYLQ